MDVIIKDFQCIQKVTLNVQGLTILQGDSNQGKSSILKGIYAATHNRFTPQQIRYGTDQATVKLRWDKNDTVLSVVRKEKGSPLMALGEHQFSKLGRSVPPEVDAWSNLGSVDVGGENYSLNFFMQFQPPLLKDFSQKRIMEMLSASQAMDDLTTVSSYLATKKQQNTGAFKATDSLIAEVKAQMSINHMAQDELRDVPALKETFEQFQKNLATQEQYQQYSKLTQRLQFTSTRANKVEALLSCMNKIAVFIQHKSQILGLLKSVRDRSVLSQRLKVNTIFEEKCSLLLYGLYTSKLSEMGQRFSKIKTAANTLDSSKLFIESREQTKQFLNLLKQRNLINSKIEEKSHLHGKMSQLFSKIDEIKSLNLYKSEVQFYLKIVYSYTGDRDRLRELGRLLSEDVCPYCGGELKVCKSSEARPPMGDIEPHGGNYMVPISSDELRPEAMEDFSNQS